MKPLYYLRFCLLFLFILVESLMVTRWQLRFGALLSPLIHFTACIGSGIVLLAMSGKRTADFKLPLITEGKTRFWNRAAIGLAASAFGIIILKECSAIFAGKPIDYQHVLAAGSDVIPQNMYFVKRFIAGTYPYKPMPFPDAGYVLTPTYLPFQWLPYTPAELFHYDYRFTGIVLVLFAIFCYGLSLCKLSLRWPVVVLLGLLPYLLLKSYIQYNSSQLQTTVEILVAAYYVFTGLALSGKNVYVTAFCLVLCLLSRYSLVLWMPLFLLLFWWQSGWKATLKMCLLLFGGIALFYGPFLIKDPYIFKKGYDYYTAASHGEWSIAKWQADKSSPFHLQQGLGLAIYFYKYINGDIDLKLQTIKLVHLIACLGSSTIMGIIFWWKRKYISTGIFMIGSLKVYLAMFYGFIIIPYSYLFVLPLLFNVAILYAAARKAASPTPQPAL